VQLMGVSLIGGQNGASGKGFTGVNPSTGEALQPTYASASPSEIDQAARLADEAFAVYAELSGKKKGEFLRHIAGTLEASGGEIVARAQLETGLPKARLDGELVRTANQLRLFAQVVEEGSWVNARIDLADPARKPLPKPDVRSLLKPLGPVAVFGASNFPLAFSVAGGDTASALAAGNPVIVKAHPAHPGTSELAGLAIRESVRACNLPQGVFSLLFDAGIEVGTQLVQHSLVKAVGFTGSFGGGRALMKLAASRPEPIPCYAEMGSVNPVFILPGALKERAADVASGLHSSFILGSGQFCTKPGLVFLPRQQETGSFVEALSDRVRKTPAQVMLTSAIADRYRSAIDARRSQDRAPVIAQSDASASVASASAAACTEPVLFSTDVAAFLESEDLSEEVFGPSTLLIEYKDHAELVAAASHLEGHLTATLHGTEADFAAHRDLISILEKKVGRLLMNGYPTGVEVCHAMVHGGPYPATSDGRSTSVGTQAIFRFARPVCYQNFSDSMLPEELKSANPLKIWRMVDGAMTRDSITMTKA
jgi:alpha-ketoglutaric semialdehyde dehydrogenase